MLPETPPPVVLSREFEHPAHVLFDAWLKPDIVNKWMFVSHNNKLLHVKIDARVSGKFSILELSSDGQEIEHYGEYFMIDRPYDLSFTLEAPKHFAGITHVSIEITQALNGCRMQFIQTGVNRDVTEQNWKAMFDRLEEVLNG